MLPKVEERDKRVIGVNYRKLDKAMHKSHVGYSIQDLDSAVQVKTNPDKNEIAQKNIQPALGKHEACINSSLGRFTIVQMDVRVYKVQVEPEENLES